MLLERFRNVVQPILTRNPRKKIGLRPTQLAMNIFKGTFRTASQGTLGQIAQTASQAVSSHRWTLWDSMDGIWSAMGARAIIRPVRSSSHLCDSTDQRKWIAVDAR